MVAANGKHRVWLQIAMFYLPSDPADRLSTLVSALLLGLLLLLFVLSVL